MDFIFIEELRLPARVGIYPREKAAPQIVEIDLAFGLPEADARGDHISDTIDYAQVVARIDEELRNRYFNLIEKLGECIVDLVMQEFGAPWARLKIAKIGVIKGVKRVGVVIRRGSDGEYDEGRERL